MQAKSLEDIEVLVKDAYTIVECSNAITELILYNFQEMVTECNYLNKIYNNILDTDSTTIESLLSNSTFTDQYILERVTLIESSSSEMKKLLSKLNKTAFDFAKHDEAHIDTKDMLKCSNQVTESVRNIENIVNKAKIEAEGAVYKVMFINAKKHSIITGQPFNYKINHIN